MERHKDSTTNKTRFQIGYNLTFYYIPACMITEIVGYHSSPMSYLRMACTDVLN